MLSQCTVHGVRYIVTALAKPVPQSAVSSLKNPLIPLHPLGLDVQGVQPRHWMKPFVGALDEMRRVESGMPEDVQEMMLLHANYHASCHTLVCHAPASVYVSVLTCSAHCPSGLPCPYSLVWMQHASLWYGSLCDVEFRPHPV